MAAIVEDYYGTFGFAHARLDLHMFLQLSVKAWGGARMLGAAGAILLLMASSMAQPVRAAAPAGNTPKPLGCLIEPDRVADLGSQVIGVVERLHVERGDTVTS